MNEVSNFDTNMYSDKLNCPPNQWDDPPYETSTVLLPVLVSQIKINFEFDMSIVAAHTGPTNRLSDKTICMVAKFGDKTDERLHYEVHNLYGYSQAIATQE